MSEIVHLGGDRFAVIERDSLSGEDAARKRVYGIDLGSITPLRRPDFAGSDAYLSDEEGELSGAKDQCGGDPIEIQTRPSEPVEMLSGKPGRPSTSGSIRPARHATPGKA